MMPTAAASEWGRGWKTVASGTLGMGMMAGVSSVTGVVMAPLEQSFGWSRAIVASNVFICSVLALLLAPALGGLINRHGVRRIAIATGLAAIPSLLLIAATGFAAWTWIAAWIVFGAINVGIGPMLWSTATAGLFEKARGVALAITLSGSGLAFFAFPPLAVLVLNRFGWRGVYIMLALMFLLLFLPLMLAWFRGRDDLEPRRKGAQGDTSGAANAVAGFTLKGALRTRHFWQLAALSGLVGFVQGAMIVHLYPILHEGGLSAAAAAGVAATMGLALIAGRLLSGFLLDRVPGPPVFATSILLILLSCVAARFVSGTILGGASIAILLGLGTGGTSNSLAFVTARYFGLASYAAIFGLLLGVFAIAYGVAPALAGLFRDIFASYTPLFIGLAVVALVSALLAIGLGRAPRLPGAAALA